MRGAATPENGGPDKPASFRDVLAAEIGYLRRARSGWHEAGADEGESPAGKLNLVGLAISGGGIRSATFNLGLLQTLALKGILPLLDYVSTVSGGGYIGSWLTAWCRRHPKGWNGVQQDLAACADPARAGCEPPEVVHLRAHARYLAPKEGLLSGDAITIATTYLRNLLLNLMLLFLVFTALLLAPRLILLGFDFVAGVDDVSVFGGAAPVLLIAVILMVKGLAEVRGGRPETKKRTKRWSEVVRWINVSGFLASGWLLATRLPGMKTPRAGDWWWWGVIAGTAYALFWLIATLWLDVGRTDDDAVAGELRDQSGRRSRAAALRLRFLGTAISGFVAAFLGGALVHAAARFLKLGLETTPGRDLHYASLGAPVVTALLMLTAVFHVGLAGKRFSEMEREWWSRLGADLLLVAGVATAINAIALYGPWLLITIHENFGRWMTSAGLSAGWLVTSAAGAFAGRSATTGGPSTKPWLKALCVAAPPIFVVGFMGLVALSVDLSLPPLLNYPIDGIPYWDRAELVQTPALLIPFGLALLLSLALSWRLGTNRFSMHALYRNRLVRCYLGASNAARRQDSFTGFDTSDDTLLAGMLARNPVSDGPPIQIVNAALNLVAGSDLARQQRKAASFVMTPLYSGYELELTRPPGGEAAGCSPTGAPVLNGYRETRLWAPALTLGAAMTVSGAAASPNMGYHSSAPLAFLMTVFNVRLGMWVRNPRLAPADLGEEPPLGLAYLLCELLGMTNAKRSHVYLSDGGHFENLGAYELLKRRCRFIIVSDAGADGAHAFADLGNLIHKARVDLRTEIGEMDLTGLRLDGLTGFTQAHCAVATIRYPEPDSQPGTLIYLKASLSGDEPEDLLTYRRRHADFPHETTGDQFFSESQFEAYRRLGVRVGEEVFGEAMPMGIGDAAVADPGLAETVLSHVADRWRLAPPAMDDRFVSVAREFQRIEERLKDAPGLEAYDMELNPELRLTALEGAQPVDHVRESFHVANMQLQLMENVYTALDLERYRHYPAYAGWMNLFRRWACSDRFRTAWAISRAIFGEPFRRFVEDDRGIGLRPLAPELKHLDAVPESDRERILEQCARILKAEPLGLSVEGDLEAAITLAKGRPTVMVFCIPIFGRPFVAAMAAVAPAAGPGETSLKWMVVRQDLRRLGVGRQVLASIVADLARRGSRAVLARPEGSPAYRSLLLFQGFRPHGQLFVWSPGGAASPAAAPPPVTLPEAARAPAPAGEETTKVG